MVLVLLLIAIYVISDLLRVQEVKTTDSKEVGTITKYDDYKAFDEKNFIIKLPSDWERIEGSTATSIKYKSGLRTHEAISLDIYINDGIPPNFDTVRALPIEIIDGKISPGLLSGRCNEFTKPKEGFGENVASPSLPSVWQGTNFMCNFSKVLNYAATTNKQTGMTTKISGPTSSGSYLFVYTDHTGRPDFTVFSNILSTFSHK